MALGWWIINFQVDTLCFRSGGTYVCRYICRLNGQFLQNALNFLQHKSRLSKSKIQGYFRIHFWKSLLSLDGITALRKTSQLKERKKWSATLFYSAFEEDFRKGVNPRSSASNRRQGSLKKLLCERWYLDYFEIPKNWLIYCQASAL